MANQRRGSAKRAAGRKRAPQRRQGTKQRRPPRHGARAGTRTARREEVARTIEPGTGAPDLHVAAPVAEPLRMVEPAPTGGEGVPGYARLVAEQAGPGADARRREAEVELGRRREQAWGGEGAPETGGLADIALELALGAMRLARTLLTAPLRIALAFLRSRDE